MLVSSSEVETLCGEHKRGTNSNNGLDEKKINPPDTLQLIVLPVIPRPRGRLNIDSENIRNLSARERVVGIGSTVHNVFIQSGIKRLRIRTKTRCVSLSMTPVKLPKHFVYYSFNAIKFNRILMSRYNLILGEREERKHQFLFILIKYFIIRNFAKVTQKLKLQSARNILSIFFLTKVCFPCC